MKKQYNQMTEEEFLSNSLKQNKPNIVFPIISSIFAVALLIALIVLYVQKEIQNGFFIFGIVILILMPVCSWYTNYFGRKYNQKKIYNFQDETDMLVKFTSKLKGYKLVDIDDSNYPEFIIEYKDIVSLGKVEFEKEKCLVNKGILTGTLMTFGVSFAGIIINHKNGNVENISGFLPRSIWIKTKLRVPEAKTGILKVNHKDLGSYTIIKGLKDDNTYYDKKTGWVCIGNKKQKENNYAVRFMENAILVFNSENKIESIWLNLGLDLEAN